MNNETKLKLRSIRSFLIKVKSRYDRGRGVLGTLIDFGQISVFAGWGVELLNRYKPLGITIPMTLFVPIMILMAITFLIIGQLDIKVFRILQAENEYNTGVLNPHFREMKQDIKKLLEK